MSSSTRIELYTNECYQCKSDTKYKALRDYVVANQIPLRNMVIKRTTLNQQWANEAREIGVEIPFVKLTKENGEVDCVNWNEFIEQNDEKPLDELTNKELKELVANYRQAVPTTIIREPKPSKSEEHPTMKPVRLIAKLIGNSSREGERVLDIFGGSGTTMIACEQLNRICYMMELDPHYADVIIERWEKFKGQKAVRIKEVA